MPKVSVIIPVYNGEKYLIECLDSVCGQTCPDIEIIIVDDGSTDSTPQILAEYREKDPRIKTYSQENKYAGVARNLGMSHANGDYLLFVDADDYIEAEAVETMYRKASENSAQICVCGAKQDFDRMKHAVYHRGYMDPGMIPEDTEVFNRETNPKYILNFTNPVVWNKLFRKSFIEEKGLRFQPIKNCEDVYFVINAMCMAERITTVEEPCVVHRKNVKGGQSVNTAKGGLDPFTAWTSTAESLKKNKIFPEQSFANRAASSIIFLLNQINEYEAFRNAVEFLQSGALSELCIKEREDGYYYKKSVDQAVKHLISDPPEQLLMYMANANYLRNSELSAMKRSRDQAIRTRNDSIAKQREKIQHLRERIQQQKEKIHEQKELIDQQKDTLAEQEKLLNSRSVKAVLKLRGHKNGNK